MILSDLMYVKYIISFSFLKTTRVKYDFSQAVVQM